MKVQSPLGAADPQAMITLLQEELEATSREVMLLTLELEQRVADRTAQLAQANQNLIREVRERMRAEAEIKQLNRDLQARAQQLEEANEELEAFSYSVSHDLRSPLSSIIGFASILHEETAGKLEEKPRQYLERIGKAGRKMATLIDDLLRFSRVSHTALVLEPVDLKELVKNILPDFEQEMEGRKVAWMVSPLPAMRCDRAMVCQVFVNLISNALKYSRGREPAEIEVFVAEDKEDEVIFAVRDNGAGFDPQHADKLFGAFQRLHSAEEFEGTGIGLANVRRIVTRHGGRVWAEGRLGVGATFYFSLPRRAG